MNISKGADITLKFNVYDNNALRLNLTSEYKITLIINKENQDFTITKNEFPCLINQEENIAQVTLPASYLDTSTTYTYNLDVIKPSGAITKSHIDSFFVCEGA